MIIKSIVAREILASSGNPTVEMEVATDSGTGKASVPTGTSTGKYEVKALLPDSIKTFNEISESLISREFNDLGDVLAIEKELYRSVSTVGGNPILCFSYALLRCLDKDVYTRLGNQSIPYQICNIIGGGSHGRGTEFQEFHAIPITQDYPASMDASGKVHKLVGEKLGAKKVGLEGAWLSKVGNESSLEILHRVCETVSDQTGIKIDLGLDIAASEFYKGGKYVYADKKLDKGDQIESIIELIKKFKLHYVEDPLDEDDFDGFSEIQRKTKSMVVGDDLFTTNSSRLKPVCKGAIVKPNQIGALHKTIEFLDALKKNGMTPTLSHRSGETEDSMLSDLAVGFGTPYIKVSVHGAERVSKMKRLKEIYEKLR
jgi:enolase